MLTVEVLKFSEISRTVYFIYSGHSLCYSAGEFFFFYSVHYLHKFMTGFPPEWLDWDYGEEMLKTFILKN